MLPTVKKSGKAVTKSALGRALERFGKHRAEKAQEVAQTVEPKQEAPYARKPDHFAMPVRCAVTGRYYEIVYIRDQSGKFAPNFQVQREGRYANYSKDVLTDDILEVSADEIAYVPDWPCPWCNKRLAPHTYIHCGRCKTLVCTGRSYIDQEGEFIHVCHDECGSRGSLGKSITSYTVESEPDQKPASTAHASRAPEQPQHELLIHKKTTVLIRRRT